MNRVKDFLQGRFMRHPLHPALVHLPIGFWVASLIFDIIYMAGGGAPLALYSLYLIGFGIVGAVLAAIAGVAELIDIPRSTLALRVAVTHAALNVLVLALYVLSFFMRGGFRAGPVPVVSGTELILNIISVGILVVSGYLGGSLIYQHGVGLRPENHVGGTEAFRRVA